MADTYQSKYTGTEIDERLEWAEGINPHMEDKGNPHEVTAAQAGALSTTDAGDLAELTTTEKGSLVGAINELDTDKVETSAIVNTLTETEEGKVLDARQGKALNDLVSTNQDVAITNLVKNGDFSNGTIGWPAVGSTISSVGNTLSIVGSGSSTVPQVQRNMSLTSIANHKYYVRAKARVNNPNAVNLYFGFLDGGSWLLIKETFPPENLWINLSGVITAISATALYIQIGHGYATASTATGQIMDVQTVTVVDLTATFGAGNEPTKAEMDTLVSLVPNQWWDGELKPSQKLLLNWQLKMIRQNRTAIIALGGTIV